MIPYNLNYAFLPLRLYSVNIIDIIIIIIAQCSGGGDNNYDDNLYHNHHQQQHDFHQRLRFDTPINQEVFYYLFVGISLDSSATKHKSANVQ